MSDTNSAKARFLCTMTVRAYGNMSGKTFDLAMLGFEAAAELIHESGNHLKLDYHRKEYGVVIRMEAEKLPEGLYQHFRKLGFVVLLHYVDHETLEMATMMN